MDFNTKTKTDFKEAQKDLANGFITQIPEPFANDYLFNTITKRLIKKSSVFTHVKKQINKKFSMYYIENGFIKKKQEQVVEEQEQQEQQEQVVEEQIEEQEQQEKVVEEQRLKLEKDKQKIQNIQFKDLPHMIKIIFNKNKNIINEEEFMNIVRKHTNVPVPFWYGFGYDISAIRHSVYVFKYNKQREEIQFQDEEEEQEIIHIEDEEQQHEIIHIEDEEQQHEIIHIEDEEEQQQIQDEEQEQDEEQQQIQDEEQEQEQEEQIEEQDEEQKLEKMVKEFNKKYSLRSMRKHNITWLNYIDYKKRRNQEKKEIVEKLRSFFKNDENIPIKFLKDLYNNVKGFKKRLQKILSALE
jgi:hypothetical protein